MRNNSLKNTTPWIINPLRKDMNNSNDALKLQCILFYKIIIIVLLIQIYMIVNMMTYNMMKKNNRIRFI